MKQYDLIVIGAGSAGLVAATTANRRGLKTALVEKNKIGGECTHYGCVPSKALINSAKAYASLNTMSDMGIRVTSSPPDFGEVMEKVDEIVQGIYIHEKPEIFQDQGIDVFVNNSGAKFMDEHTIAVGDEFLKAKNFIICTGSSPRILDLKGIESINILHNENFWNTRKHPGRIVFIGGGVISVELGQALAKLGCEVSIIDRNDRILKVTDEEIGQFMCNYLTNQGVNLITKAEPVEFEDSNTLVYTREGKQQKLKADSFFMAVGRNPNIIGLDLSQAGIRYTSKGIETNQYLQSSQPHIYACGDVTTPLKFTHTASHQANICVDNIINGPNKTNDLSIFPWAIFTDPEIAHIGLTIDEATKKFGKNNVKVFKVDAAIDRFITDRKTGGFLKVIFDNNDLVLGAEAVGAHAGEWLQILTPVIKNQIPVEEIVDTIFTYPTYSEIVKKAFTRYHRTKQ